MEVDNNGLDCQPFCYKNNNRSFTGVKCGYYCPNSSTYFKERWNEQNLNINKSDDVTMEETVSTKMMPQWTT